MRLFHRRRRKSTAANTAMESEADYYNIPCTLAWQFLWTWSCSFCRTFL